MRSLGFVSLLAILMISAVLMQSVHIAHAHQPAVLSDGQMLFAAWTMPLATAAPTRVFGKPVPYASGGDPAAAVVVADLNGDGKLDVVVANQGPYAVSVLLGNGDGTLQAPVSYVVGGEEPTSIAVGDVNGDGHPDLIVATNYEVGNGFSGGVAVLLGKGDGTFEAPVSYSSGGFEAISVAIADVDGDGHPDLIVANECSIAADCGVYPSSSVGVLHGNGDGTFEAPVSFVSGYGTDGMAVVDVNRDGAVDLIVAGEGDIVGVMLGNGDGTFQSVVAYDLGGFSSSIAVEDVNGDGKLDVVGGVICPTACPSAALSVLLGNGDGTFQTPILSSLPTEDLFSSIAIRDLDGDGKPDVVLASFNSASAEVLLGNGDGTFQAPQKYLAGLRQMLSVAVADLDADGKPDLLAAGKCGKCAGTNLNLQVLLNRFDAPASVALTSSPNPSLVDQAVTFTATVTSNPPVPDGAVITFFASKNNSGTGTTKNGAAHFTTSFSRAETYTVKASYPGDLFHKTSSGTVKQAVSP